MNKEKTARIILLNGASSSGKSTLAKQLQKDSCEPFWHWSFDHLRDQTILPMERFRSNEFSWEVQREAIFDGFHRSIAAFASSGNNLIIEHIIENRIWHLQLQELLKPFNLLFVGLHCPLDTLKTRERERGNRNIGEAEKDFETIHKFVNYDIELHCTQDVKENSVKIFHELEFNKCPSSFFDNSRH